MKIFHFLPWYSPRNIGGTELYLRNLAKFQKTMGNEVLITCPSISEQTEEFLLDEIKVVCFPSFIDNDDRLTVNGNTEPNYLDEFFSFLENEKPDILHFHGLWPDLYYYFDAAAKLRIKTVISLHLAIFTCPKGSLKRNNKQDCDGLIKEIKCTTCFYSHNKGVKRTFANLLSIGTFLLQKIASRKQNSFYTKLTNTSFQINSKIKFLRKLNSQADAIVAISQWYFDNLKKNCFNDKKLFLVKQGVLMPKEELERIPKKYNKNELVRFIYIGRVSTEKGVGLILEALELISQYKDKFELYIYGKLIDDSMLKEIQDKINKGFKITLKGEVPQNELFGQLAEVDMLILPSVGSEMAPLVIQEAFAYGIPVIGSNISGIKDMIRHGENGFLFTANDPKSLASEMEYILNNPDVALALKSNITTPRNINDIALEYQDIYESIL